MCRSWSSLLIILKAKPRKLATSCKIDIISKIAPIVLFTLLTLPWFWGAFGRSHQRPHAIMICPLSLVVLTAATPFVMGTSNFTEGCV